MSQENSKQELKLFGWSLRSWIESSENDGKSPEAEIVFCASLNEARQQLTQLQTRLPAWQTRSLNLEEGDLWVLYPAEAPLILLKPKPLSEAQKRDANLLAPSEYAAARDLLGRAYSELKKLKATSVRVRFEGASRMATLGALVGLEVAAYSYKTALQPAPLPRLELSVDRSLIKEASNIGLGINIARHLVNTPPNLLYPEAFATAAAQLFYGHPTVRVEIWDAERLEREQMGLLLAVGQASEQRPCMLRLSYRPEKGTQENPIALVGKGITFDSGGLDIKDAGGMRLMKKDMGGAAAVVGALYSLVHNQVPRAIDAWLPMAENAISGRAFRPGDIIRAKNGMTVEIHNTDAEGRLILADAMAAALSQTGENRPAAILVAATLTGAIKVGLGSDVAGFFASDEELASQLSRQAQNFGDLMWRMPLFDGYRPKLESPVADLVHCATGSFGGAITAALFLAEFAKGFPFAHMDIYAWTDGERGALREAGGSGQAVQTLVGVMQSYKL